MRKAADQGVSRGATCLGLMVHRGEGIGHDAVAAADWYGKAAEQGSAAAQFDLGNCYAEGWGVGQDRARAAVWYRKAAEQDTSWRSSSWATVIHGRRRARDLGEAARWFTRPPRRGTRPRSTTWGCATKGEGVPRDEAQAAAWLRKAAEQGLPIAQNTLGVQYAKAVGSPGRCGGVCLVRPGGRKGPCRAIRNRGILAARMSAEAKDRGNACSMSARPPARSRPYCRKFLSPCLTPTTKTDDKTEAYKPCWYRVALQARHFGSQASSG